MVIRSFILWYNYLKDQLATFCKYLFLVLKLNQNCFMKVTVFNKIIGHSFFVELKVNVPYRHGGGWSKKINAWYLNTLMVYL